MRRVREEVVPALSTAAGVRAAYWLVDRGGGKRLSFFRLDLYAGRSGHHALHHPGTPG